MHALSSRQYRKRPHHHPHARIPRHHFSIAPRFTRRCHSAGSSAIGPDRQPIGPACIQFLVPHSSHDSQGIQGARSTPLIRSFSTQLANFFPTSYSRPESFGFAPQAPLACLCLPTPRDATAAWVGLQDTFPSLAKQSSGLLFYHAPPSPLDVSASPNLFSLTAQRDLVPVLSYPYLGQLICRYHIRAAPRGVLLSSLPRLSPDNLALTHDVHPWVWREVAHGRCSTCHASHSLKSFLLYNTCRVFPSTRLALPFTASFSASA